MSETAGKAGKSTGDRAPEARSRPTGGFFHQRHPAAAALGGGAPIGEAAAAGSHAGEGSDKAQPARQPPNAWHRRAEELGEEEDADVAYMYQQQANMAEALFDELSLEDKAGQGAQEKTHAHVQKQELPARISPTVSADGVAPAGAQPQQPQPQPQPQSQQPQQPQQPQQQPQQQMHHFQQTHPQFQQPQLQQQQALGADGFGYGYQQYYDASGMPFIPQYQVRSLSFAPLLRMALVDAVPRMCTARRVTKRPCRCRHSTTTHRCRWLTARRIHHLGSGWNTGHGLTCATATRPVTTGLATADSTTRTTASTACPGGNLWGG